MKLRINWLFILVMAVALWNCNNSPTAQYERLVLKELASGERYDSLFLGIHFGMDAETFFKHCWELNHQKLVKEGPGNTTVEYYLPDQENAIRMLFYPKFYNNLIYEMPVEFTYDAWAPWNKEFFSDKLILEIIRVFESWYGEGFVEIKHPERGSVWVKVDGNRRISVWCHDEQKVKALFTDLVAEQERKKEEKELSSK